MIVISRREKVLLIGLAVVVITAVSYATILYNNQKDQFTRSNDSLIIREPREECRQSFSDGTLVDNEVVSIIGDSYPVTKHTTTAKLLSDAGINLKYPSDSVCPAEIRITDRAVSAGEHLYFFDNFLYADNPSEKSTVLKRFSIKNFSSSDVAKVTRPTGITRDFPENISINPSASKLAFTYYDQDGTGMANDSSTRTRIIVKVVDLTSGKISTVYDKKFPKDLLAPTQTKWTTDSLLSVFIGPTEVGGYSFDFNGGFYYTIKWREINTANKNITRSLDIDYQKSMLVGVDEVDNVVLTTPKEFSGDGYLTHSLVLSNIDTGKEMYRVSLPSDTYVSSAVKSPDNSFFALETANDCDDKGEYFGEYCEMYSLVLLNAKSGELKYLIKDQKQFYSSSNELESAKHIAKWLNSSHLLLTDHYDFYTIDLDGKNLTKLDL